MVKYLSAISVSLWITCVSLAGEPIAVQPRPLIVGQQNVAWEFADGAGGWTAGSLAAATAEQGSLKITSRGEDPNVFSPALKLKGPLAVQLRVRVGTAGSGELFWTTDGAPEWSAQQSRGFRLKHDGQWHAYAVLIGTDQTVTQLRVDLGSAAGKIEVDWVRVSKGQLHRLEIREIRSHSGVANVRIRNHHSRALHAHLNGQSVPLRPAEEKQVLTGGKAFNQSVASDGEKASNAPQWESLPPMPVPNGGFAAGVIGDSLIVIGGTTWENGAKRWLSDTWSFNLKNRTWREEKPLPGPLAYAAAVSSEDLVTVIGGTGGVDALKGVSRLTRWTPLTPLAELPSPLVYAAAAEGSDGIYVAGGGSDPNDLSTLTNAFRRIDRMTAKVSDLPPLPGAGRMLPAIAASGDEVLVVGGGTFDPTEKKVVNTADAAIYSVKDQRWRAVRSYPAARRGIVATALDDNWIYLAGGYGAIPGKAAEGFSDEAYLYSRRDDAYVRIPSLPYATMGPSLAKDQDFLYVLGGEDRMKSRSAQVVRVRWRELIPGP